MGRTTSDERAPGASSPRASNDYFALSMRPLYCFWFLGVLVALFEAGTLLYLTDQREGIQHTVRARRLLDLFFQNFGVAGFMATGLAMLTVLLVWHVLTKPRQPWTVRPAVLAGMALEASLWALPLVVFGTIFQRTAFAALSREATCAAESFLLGGGGWWAGGAALLPALASDAGTRLLDMSWQARVTIAIGAGIYEEMLFRLVGMAAVHFVARDLLQARELTARAIAVGVTAVAFAAYHDVGAMGGGAGGVGGVMPRAEQLAALGFYCAAGVYFGVIYLTRGFGIVVAAHAVYDVLALVVLAPRS
ncbi:MAG: CPBP family glutamic-type intramembrane protease [Phycisphaerales bacterium]